MRQRLLGFLCALLTTTSLALSQVLKKADNPILTEHGSSILVGDDHQGDGSDDHGKGCSRAGGSEENLLGWLKVAPLGVPITTPNSNPDRRGILNQPGTAAMACGDNHKGDGSNGLGKDASAPPVVSKKIAPPAEKADIPVLTGHGFSMPACDVHKGDRYDGRGKGCSRAWGSAEYLLWWFKDAPLGVPIATLNSNPDRLGILGQPGTAVGSPDRLNFDGPFSGGRVTVGLWLDDDSTYGIEGGGFLLQGRSARFGVNSPPGGTRFFVPFLSEFANTPPRETALPFGAINARSGSIEAENRTRLWGAEVNGLYNLMNTDTVTMSLLGGFRYLNLRESLDLSIVGTGPGGIFTTRSLDHFGAQNQFWGGQLGARGEARFGKFFTNLTGKIALGEMRESVNVIGIANLNTRGVNVSVPGGFFALLSNGGRQANNFFAVVPQVGVQGGYDVTNNLRVFAGYDFLIVSNVVRPGDQLDRRINFDRQAVPIGGGGFTGPAVPAPQLNHTDFWAQGLSAGLRYSF